MNEICVELLTPSLNCIMIEFGSVSAFDLSSVSSSKS